MTGEPSGVDQQRRGPLHPPQDADVIDLDPVFGEQFFDVAVGEAVALVPPRRDDDHVGREVEPGKRRLWGRVTVATGGGLHRSSVH